MTRKFNCNLLGLLFLFGVSFSIKAQISEFHDIHIEDFGDLSSHLNRLAHGFTNIGDIDGDGDDDLVVSFKDYYTSDSIMIGAICLVHLDAHQQIDSVRLLNDEILNVLPKDIKQENLFRVDLDNVGDLDGNGFNDLLLGVPGFGGNWPTKVGAYGVVFLGEGGEVLNVNYTRSEFFGLEGFHDFGTKARSIGDLNFDGRNEICVSVPDLATGPIGDNAGGVIIIYLDEFGNPANWKMIENNYLSIDTGWGNDWGFGVGVAGDKDLNDDGYIDVVIGVPHGEFEGYANGELVILYLDGLANLIDIGFIHYVDIPDLKISDSHFGSSVMLIDDVNGDGRPEILAGANWEDTEAWESGMIHIISLNEDGEVYETGELFDNLVDGMNLEDLDQIGFGLELFYNEQGEQVVLSSCEDQGDGYEGFIRFMTTDFGNLKEISIPSSENKLVKSNFKIYPNPAQATLNVIASSSLDNYKILSFDGKLLFTGNLHTGNNKIDISSLTQGSYIFSGVGDKQSQQQVFHVTD